MKTNLIKTDNYILIVSDEEIEGYYYDTYVGKIKHSGGAEFGETSITKKIIAHKPLNNSPILEGVKLLDDIELIPRELLNKDGSPMREYKSEIIEQLIREEKLETLAKLLAKSWFYGNWEWENPNERIMQMLMQDLGYYPFKNEDEMIQQTRVDEDLYKEAVDKVELRNPRIMPIENHIVDSNEMIDQVPDVGKMVSNTYTEEQVR